MANIKPLSSSIFASHFAALNTNFTIFFFCNQRKLSKFNLHKLNLQAGLYRIKEENVVTLVILITVISVPKYSGVKWTD